MTLELIFGPTGHTSGAQECARAVAIFIYGLVAVRLAGRRAFAQWTPLDIVVGIVTGSSLSRALTGNADLGGTMAATSVVMLLHWVLSHASAKWPSVSRLLEGSPVRLGANGAVDEGALRRHAVSRSALDAAFRGAGVDGAAGSRLIVLEPSGKLSIVKAGDTAGP